ncbi:putative Bro-N domain-containing protein 3 [Diachasmimorpha longicaudata entomopoxvirus]|uniref:Putative Bro-N domain-containing protein 3 n=1 Tax=Diachasmimorpha longicaudata entomopoxvirus TaxID=109981 RepID=A0A7R5WF14_9POXV|nr:putative Bro-N domain-containing protein 3 [Diachasmimorpha longicaudata entomopoxvirus]AKS26305.1 putative Bro-N domain-containing protein 3 [Diachasmimorpha longicaudata entomopoxvirus]
MVSYFVLDGEQYHHAKEFGKEKLRYLSKHFDDIIKELPDKYKKIKDNEVYLNISGLILVTMRSAKPEARDCQVYIVDTLIPRLQKKHTEEELEKQTKFLHSEIRWLKDRLKEKEGQYARLISQISDFTNKFSGLVANFKHK